MMIGARTTALVLLLAFATGISATAHARATPGRKCEKLRKKQRKRFLNRRLGKNRKRKSRKIGKPGRLTKCANKALRKGTDASLCLTSRKTQGRIHISPKVCSIEALEENHVIGRDCSEVNARCVGTIVDAASLQTCLQCALTNSSNCLVAIEYGLAMEDCF